MADVCRTLQYRNLHHAHKMPSTTHSSMHSALLRKKSDALRSSARSGYLMRRLRHAVSRPCDAICAVLEPSAVLRVVRCGRCCSHIRFCDELIADALSPLPRACGASAHQLAAADAPWAASLADAFCPCACERSSARASLEHPARVEGRPRAHPRAIEAWRTGCGQRRGLGSFRSAHDGRRRP